jgi:SpoVK/Ycf46/Vps4 family AAA+-type ATPase
MDGNNGGGLAKPNEELVITEKPKVNWDEVVGLDVAKKAVKEAIVYLCSVLTCSRWVGLVAFCCSVFGLWQNLFGRAVATEIDASFYSIDAASIMSKWLGEAEQNVAKLFGSARKTLMMVNLQSCSLMNLTH